MLGWLALTGAGGVAVAADALPPLRVDPTLLGGAPLRPAPAPVQPAAATAAAPTAAPTTTAPIESSAPSPAPASAAAEVRPVTPPPVARDIPSTPQPATPPDTAVARPAVTTATAAASTAAPAVQRQPAPALPPRAAGTQALQNLPPLRVDPALLGGTALAQRTPVSTATQPPEVAELPELAPLFSAYAAAGRIPHPSSTPMSATDKNSAPTFISARKLSGINDVETVAEGSAVLARAGDTLSAERLTYRVADDEVEAVGNVRLTSPDTQISGPRLRMRMQDSTGEFEAPVYAIRRELPPIPEPALTIMGLPSMTDSGRAIATTGRMIERPPVTGSGAADRIEFRGEDHYHLANATYSTCAPGRRDWEVRVDTLDLDYNSETGTGRNAVVSFMNVPLFYTPWLSFSLNNARKSGFLPPTIGTSSKSGFELAVPWYWNIAPNMDATITPRLMTRRGMQVNGEFRYVVDTAQNRAIEKIAPGAALPDRGQVRIEYLPNDKLANRDRHAYSIQHNQTFLLPGHSLAANLNLNGVSDPDYFSDLSTRLSEVTKGNMLRRGMATLGGPWYSATLNFETYQSLLTTGSPYRRIPQITATANRYDLPFGMALNFNAEYVNYDHPDLLTGKRTTLYPQLSLPLRSAAFFATPKLGVHSTHYELASLDKPDTTGSRYLSDTVSRAVPIFSLDSGLFLERAGDWFGRDLTQTLEPRAYYVYVPKHGQSKIPVFDTGLAGFNYAQMFSENRYAGNDRIGDANQLTMALTSRLIDSTSGAELLRATLGTRYYFTLQDRNSSLPNEPLRSGRSADLLATLTGQVLPNIYADLGWQYNPRDDQTERLTVGARYRPGPGKIINASYRFARDQGRNASGKLIDLDQIDLSGQWPLFGGWHGVGRYNYSLEESRVIETIGGLEYDAGCWATRLVVQRQATIAEKPTTAIFVQLELNDFSKIGSNPMNLLRRNIPGYGIINQPTADPVFAEQ